MSTTQLPRPQSSSTTQNQHQTNNALTYFEQQREDLVREIALSFEQVLQNINRLNRNLESVIAVGNEFSSVEALWSQFENVMGERDRDRDGDRDGDGDGDGDGDANDGKGGGGDGEDQGEREGSGEYVGDRDGEREEGEGYDEHEHGRGR
ncbi:hypothetical protein FQN51_001145 [Onygenales sp. PD_10]|nr:hypothetical protein FQN51_001145 [Onygenales sp. PD_10]